MSEFEEYDVYGPFKDSEDRCPVDNVEALLRKDQWHLKSRDDRARKYRAPIVAHSRTNLRQPRSRYQKSPEGG